MKPVFKKKLPPMPATLTSLRAYTQTYRLFEDTPNARALRLHAAHNWDAWYESACLPDSIGFSSYVQSLVSWNNDRGNPLSLDIAAAATSLTVRGWFNVEAQLVEYDLKAKLHDWSATSVAYGVVTYRQDTLDSMELPPELTQYGGTSWTEKVMANLHEVYYQKAMPSLVMMITLTFMVGYIAMWTGLATWGPASSAVQAEWLSTVEWSLLGVFLLLLGGLFRLDERLVAEHVITH